MKTIIMILLITPMPALTVASESSSPLAEIEAWRKAKAACYQGAEERFRSCMRGVVHDGAFIGGIRLTVRRRPADCSGLLDDNGKAKDGITSQQFDQCLWTEPRKDYGVDLSDARAAIRDCLSSGEATFNPHFDRYIIYSSEVICSLEHRDGRWGLTEVTGRG